MRDYDRGYLDALTRVSGVAKTLAVDIAEKTPKMLEAVPIMATILGLMTPAQAQMNGGVAAAKTIVDVCRDLAAEIEA